MMSWIRLSGVLGDQVNQAIRWTKLSGGLGDQVD